MATQRTEIGTLASSGCHDTRQVVAVITAVRRCHRKVEVDVADDGSLVFRAHWPVKKGEASEQ